MFAESKHKQTSVIFFLQNFYEQLQIAEKTNWYFMKSRMAFDLWEKNSIILLLEIAEGKLERGA